MTGVQRALGSVLQERTRRTTKDREKWLPRIRNRSTFESRDPLPLIGDDPQLPLLTRCMCERTRLAAHEILAAICCGGVGGGREYRRDAVVWKRFVYGEAIQMSYALSLLNVLLDQTRNK